MAVTPWDGAISTRNRSGISEPVHAPRGAAEEGELLVGRGAGCDPLEGIPQARVAGADLLDRKVALEGAAVCAKELDAVLRVRAPVSGQLLGGGRRRNRAVVERGQPPHHAAEFDDDVRTRRK